MALKIAALQLDNEMMVLNAAARVVALNTARVLRTTGTISWVARSWKNADGTYTIRAVKA